MWGGHRAGQNKLGNQAMNPGIGVALLVLALARALWAIPLSPIDTKAPGLKRPSKVLKKFLLCVVRMAKKPLSVVRDMKKVMVFPSNFVFGLALK
jgi:hypothetical protein